MKNESSSSYKQKEIYNRIDEFVLSVLSFVKLASRNLVNIEILKQSVRSVVSIGANAKEAQAAQTKKEFIADLKKTPESDSGDELSSGMSSSLRGYPALLARGGCHN